jgi:hypothetical protein
MRELSDDEARAVRRYVTAIRNEDRLSLFALSRGASNAYLRTVEAAIDKESPSDYDLTYLHGIARRMGSNYRKLMGMDGALRVARALRAKTFNDLPPEARP